MYALNHNDARKASLAYTVGFTLLLYCQDITCVLNVYPGRQQLPQISLTPAIRAQVFDRICGAVLSLELRSRVHGYRWCCMCANTEDCA
jgi:hypothetical protein